MRSTKDTEDTEEAMTQKAPREKSARSLTFWSSVSKLNWIEQRRSPPQMERPGNRPRAFRTYTGESRSSDGDERLGCRHAETRSGPRTCATTTVPPEEHRPPINPHPTLAVKRTPRRERATRYCQRGRSPTGS